MGNKGLELADIIKENKMEFLDNRSVTNKQKRVLSSIEYCRTERLGYHLDQCPEFSHKEISYNSCRDRHCPKCQGIAQRQWVEKRTEQLLLVPYYHVVFTLPSNLFPYSLYNKKLIYDSLFEAASSTLKQFGKDPQWFGGKLGFYGILHTWGQTLWHHPHLHFIVAGGAIGDDGKWISPKHKGKFLFPVHALSDVFRGKFMNLLEKAIENGEFELPEDVVLTNQALDKDIFLRSLVQKDWVVYCKSPFKSAKQVINYIGRYTHWVSISNSRLISFEDEAVEFSYRDYRDGNKKKEMCLDSNEFLQRFLWHVLPERFHRIRHYGFLANGCAERLVAKIRGEIGETDSEVTQEKTLFGCICKNCGAGIMLVLKLITATGHLVNVNNHAVLNST